jgi:hypothetical protein
VSACSNDVAQATKLAVLLQRRSDNFHRSSRTPQLSHRVMPGWFLIRLHGSLDPSNELQPPRVSIMCNADTQRDVIFPLNGIRPSEVTLSQYVCHNAAAHINKVVRRTDLLSRCKKFNPVNRQDVSVNLSSAGPFGLCDDGFLQR